jgi:hypothetical protein
VTKPVFAADYRPPRSACHAEGRGFESLQPLLKRSVFAGPFLRAQSACASASSRTNSGLAPGRSSAVPKKTPCLQAHSGSSEPKSFCGPAERRVFACCGPYPYSYCSGTIQRTAPAGAIPPVAVLGASPVSVRKREVNLGPLRGNPQRAMAPRAVSCSGDGVRRSGAVPTTGTLCRGSTRGSSPRVPLSIGTQRSARTWSGLLVVVHSRSRASLRESVEFTRTRKPPGSPS